MDKFRNKYRIPSARLQTWDYGNNGSYFITICTKQRLHFFGEISDHEMHLNEMGKLAEQFWIEIPNEFPFIVLGNFVIMPNHVHGILIINKPDTSVETRPNVKTRPDVETRPSVETRLIASLPTAPAPIKTGGVTGQKNPMFQENISRVCRWYKGRCSFEIRKIHADFGWQSRFYDHIICDSNSFERVQNYIGNNPLIWGNDKFYS